MNLRKHLWQLRDRLASYKIVALFNPFFNLFIGGARRPLFFDIDRVYPSLRLLDQQYGTIRAEFDAIMPMRQQMPRYHDIDDDLLYASGRIDRDKRWNVFMLYCYGEKPAFNRARCPATCALLERIPFLCQALFSILDAGKSIPRHTSPSRYYLRYHLGMQVPASNPPFILLKDQKYTWREGESVLFDDSWDHEIVNHASEPRAVLIVDVLRPMAWPAHLLGRAIMLLARSVYAIKMHRRAANYVWKVD